MDGVFAYMPNQKGLFNLYVIGIHISGIFVSGGFTSHDFASYTYLIDLAPLPRNPC